MSDLLQFKVLHPIGLDGRRERGEIISLTQEVADNYPGKLERVSEEKKEVAPVEVPLDEMNLHQLVEKAKALGLNTEGHKADLFDRINLHLTGSVEAPKGDETKPEATVEAPKGDETKPEATVEAPKGDETVA